MNDHTYPPGKDMPDVDTETALGNDELDEYNIVRKMLKYGAEPPDNIREAVENMTGIDIDNLLYAKSEDTPLYLLIRTIIPNATKITISTKSAAVEIMYPDSEDVPVEAIGYPLKDGKRLWIQTLNSKADAEQSPTVRTLLL